MRRKLQSVKGLNRIDGHFLRLFAVPAVSLKNTIQVVPVLGLLKPFYGKRVKVLSFAAGIAVQEGKDGRRKDKYEIQKQKHEEYPQNDFHRISSISSAGIFLRLPFSSVYIIS